MEQRNCEYASDFDSAVWDTVTAVHRSPVKLGLVTCGAGTRLISHLMNHPGASAVIVEAAAPYAQRALESYVRDSGETKLSVASSGAVSAQTALSLARAAYRRAIASSSASHHACCCGLSVTAALATNRVRRGEDRAFVAFRCALFEHCFILNFDRNDPRVLQEELLSAQTLRLLAVSVGLPRPAIQAPGLAADAPLPPLVAAPTLNPALHAIVSTGSGGVVVGARSTWSDLCAANAESLQIIYPGSFNPPHRGHMQVMHAACHSFASYPPARACCPTEAAAYAIALGTFDKPAIEPASLFRRCAHLTRMAAGPRQLLLSCCPAFVDLAELVRGAAIVCGVDTACRILQPKWYDGDAGRDCALKRIRTSSSYLLVAPRAQSDWARADAPTGTAEPAHPEASHACSKAAPAGFLTADDAEALSGARVPWEKLGFAADRLLCPIPPALCAVRASSSELRADPEREWQERVWE